MNATASILDNRAWADVTPRLSILIPSYRDEPSRLLAALDRPDLAIEIVLLDDGSGDGDLTFRLGAAIESLSAPARFIGLSVNQGRAAGRNRLAASARAAHLLFLDADMLPDRSDFLDRWIALAESGAPAVVFGGYSLEQAPRSAASAVHRKMALHSDCLTAEQRRRAPEKYLFTSNLLIRRDVFETEPFDAGFTGWGWEDVEWAIRVSRRYQILHADIPATHLGLDPPAVLTAKYEQAAANFARVAAAHPDIVHAYPSYRVAQILKRTPLLRLWRPWLKAAVLQDWMPVSLRAFALRLYRAALYADVV